MSSHKTKRGSMSEQDWDARTRQAQAGLTPLRFLLGRWRGAGHSHGAPISATLEVRLCLGGTFIEARETLYDADGALDHEDISFYRFDAREGHIRVRQMMAPALLSERLVLPLPDGGGVRWYEGPLGVQVFFSPTPDGGLKERVLLPLQSEPAVVIAYHPDEP